ncbi:MAG TPA: hypothetical protein VNP04_20965 [Alphaproteobacteria bacterium]|nr:hypothetical protein [Alphaproteobacteria bacterium]
MNQPVRIEFVGLLPETLRTCMAHYCVPGQIGRPDIEAQLREYPHEIQAIHHQAVALYERLLRDFGDRIRPQSVMLTSGRGLWLALRHRLRGDLSLVLNGQRVVPGDAPYETVRAAIEEELGRPISD